MSGSKTGSRADARMGTNGELSINTGLPAAKVINRLINDVRRIAVNLTKRDFLVNADTFQVKSGLPQHFLANRLHILSHPG